jgi:DNA-directed RNA polymerase subunit M/transcription elongation factor TFIIS
MSSKELCPDKYKYIDNKLNQRFNLEIKKKISELYKCIMCKNNKTTIRTSAILLDESDDLNITCILCGYEWRE